MESSPSAKVSYKQMGGFSSENQLHSFLESFEAKEFFDRDIFANLVEDTNEETVVRILAHFSENLRDGVAKIEESLGTETCEEVWKVSHKISGSAELLGFKPYADRSRDLSRQIRANPVFEVHEAQIRGYLKETADLLREITTAFPTLKAFL